MTRIFGTGKTLSDEQGKPIYRRFRTCVNPACRLYLIRRTSIELYAVVDPIIQVVTPTRIPKNKFAPRITPPPEDNVIGVNV